MSKKLHVTTTINGELMTDSATGPWTVDGAIQVAAVHLSHEVLVIDGTRRFYGYDFKHNALLPFNLREKDQRRVKVEIALDAPLSNLDQAISIMDRIFVSNEQELIDIVPDYWRSFLEKQYGKPRPDAWDNDASAVTTATPSGTSSAAPPRWPPRSGARPYRRWRIYERPLGATAAQASAAAGGVG